MVEFYLPAGLMCGVHKLAENNVPLNMIYSAFACCVPLLPCPFTVGSICLLPGVILIDEQFLNIESPLSFWYQETGLVSLR